MLAEPVDDVVDSSVTSSFRPAHLRKADVKQRHIDIANLAFIDGRTNRKIQADPPKDYLPPLIETRGEEVFDAQAIPTDQSLFALCSRQRSSATNSCRGHRLGGRRRVAA